MIPADVYAEIEQCRLKLGSIAVDSPERRKLIHELLQQIEQGIDTNTVNVKVQILIEQAKKLSQDNLAPIQQTLCQRELLSQAIAIIEQSGKLWRNYEEAYRDAYSEAWLKTLEYFYRHFEDYDPSKAQVATWLNFRLKNEFKTQQGKLFRQTEQTVQTNHLDDESQDLLAMMASPSYGEQANLMKDEIETWIEQDPALKTTSIRHQPQITAKALLQRRFIEEAEWGQLANEFGVTVATLSSFYERQCRTRLIGFVETNFDIAPPDTPINPCEHLRGLSQQKPFRHINVHACLSEWVASEPQLQTLALRGKPEITAQLFFQQVLLTLQKPRQGLVQVAGALGVDSGELERFYEFQLMNLVLEVLHKKAGDRR
ncbi:MAG: hypothetical protein ACO36E_08725 [Synechocystis sp.]